MDEPVYFSKIIFTEQVDYKRQSVITIDVNNKELSYQVLSYDMNALAFYSEERINNSAFSYIKMRNGKNDFQPEIIKEDACKPKSEFEYGLSLSEQQYESLLPYCNSLDFEPYRNRKMSMKDDGYIGYRDNITVTFYGVTNSYIPYIELPMDYYYDEKHIWPSEKLYRYIYRKFLGDNKEVEKWLMEYGAFSLFLK